MNRGLLASVLAVLLSQAGVAWSQGVIQRFELEQFPFGLNTTLDPVFNNEGGKDKTTYSISCYDVNTQALLDCRFRVQITGLVQPETDVANNGGHNPLGHSGARPLGTLQFGAARGATIRRRTANTVVEVKHVMPEVSGKIKTEVLIESPPNFFCFSVCFTRTSHKFEGATSVGIPRLTSLPGPSGGVPVVTPGGLVAPYTKERKPEKPVKHADEDSFYGQDDTLLTLPLIAQEYKDRSGRHLSVNDMSLPKGGKFDVFGRWTGDHGEHRIGKSADINQEGIPCKKDRPLRDAVDTVIPPEGPRFVKITGARTANPMSRLLCESEGRKHIDFDGVIGLIP